MLVSLVNSSLVPALSPLRTPRLPADSTFARAVEGLPRERILTVLVFGGHILCANQTLPVYSTKSYEIHALPFLNLFNEVHLEYHYASGAPLQLVS